MFHICTKFGVDRTHLFIHSIDLCFQLLVISFKIISDQHENKPSSHRITSHTLDVHMFRLLKTLGAMMIRACNSNLSQKLLLCLKVGNKKFIWSCRNVISINQSALNLNSLNFKQKWFANKNRYWFTETKHGQNKNFH